MVVAGGRMGNNQANETVDWEYVEDTYLAPPQALGVHMGPPRSRHQDRRDLLGKSHFPVRGNEEDARTVRRGTGLTV